jgi:pimeloyl-ACP methyl ester carboxylesterase
MTAYRPAWVVAAGATRRRARGARDAWTEAHGDCRRPPIMTGVARRTGLAAVAVAAIGAARYRRDLKRDWARLDTFDRLLVETPFGRAEYAQAGYGPPVLVVHGVLGGFDFGVGAGRVNAPPGHRIISPSRFGFFGSPLPADPSPAAQADAFAALLDHLEITQLPVVAFSAGSSSAVQLTRRHPERVSRLVLISPNAPHPEPLPKPPRLLAPILFSQPVFWVMRLLARSRLEGMAGTPAGFVPNEREHAALRELTDSLFADRTRALPVNDPHDRELTISCAAAWFKSALPPATAASRSTHRRFPMARHPTGWPRRPWAMACPSAACRRSRPSLADAPTARTSASRMCTPPPSPR